MNQTFKKLSAAWMEESCTERYSYRFTWMGVPIIQYPQDMIAMQELIWKVKPDCIIETGIAHGGSLVYYASLLEMLGGHRSVIGIDIDIRPPTRETIAHHPTTKTIRMFEGSSIDPYIVNVVWKMVDRNAFDNVMVVIDSNHTHDHVLAELRAYAPLVAKDSYLVVFDTIIEQLPDEYWSDRPWKKGNNPSTAVDAFLEENKNFKRCHKIDNKLAISVAPGGYLKRIA